MDIKYPNGVQADFIYDPARKDDYGAAMLSEIKVSSAGNCLRYKLGMDSVCLHHPTQQWQSDSIYTRWFLDSITMLSCDGSLSEPYYSFTYDPVRLPLRLNSAQDLFGYYNGDSTGIGLYFPNSSGNQLSIPAHGSYNNYGMDRFTDFYFTKAGLLTTIQNAYGGELEFHYGPNYAVDMLDNIHPSNDINFIDHNELDGVRIDSVIERDKFHPGNITKTVFTYSGGQLFLTGGYFSYPEHIDSASNEWDMTDFQSMFLTAHQLINGSNHGYSSVSVRTYADDSMLSRRDITFSNMQDATSDNQPRYYKVPGSKDYFEYPYTDKQYLKDWEIGLPLTITDYDQNNRIVQKTINKYRFNAPVDDSAAAYISNTKTAKVNSGVYFMPLLGAGGFSIEYYYPYKKTFTDDYFPFRGWAPLDTTITQKYVSDNRYVSDTVVYIYDDRHNLKSTITQNSEGERVATKLVYNYDVDGADLPWGSPHPGTTLYNMSDSGLEKVVSSERWLLHPSTQVSGGPGGGVVLLDNDLLLSAYITGYRYQDDKLWTGSLWNTTIGSPLTHIQYTGLVGGSGGNPYGKVLDAYNTGDPVTGFRRMSEVKLFDSMGRPLETQLLDQNQFKAMIWDSAGHKLAEAANCRYSDIAYSSFEAGLSESNLSVSGATPNTTSDPVTGTHVLQLWTPVSPGTATIITGTQNLQAGTAYELSFWVKGTAPAVQVGGSALSLSPANVAYTKGSWKNYIVRFTPSTAGKLRIIGAAPLTFIDEIRLCPAGAQMQSWTYEPLVGISSHTDASGRATYYEHDPFGRQTITRDQDGNILSQTEYHIGQ